MAAWIKTRGKTSLEKRAGWKRESRKNVRLLNRRRINQGEVSGPGCLFWVARGERKSSSWARRKEGSIWDSLTNE